MESMASLIKATIVVNRSTTKTNNPGANILNKINKNIMLKKPYNALNIFLLLDFKALRENRMIDFHPKTHEASKRFSSGDYIL